MVKMKKFAVVWVLMICMSVAFIPTAGAVSLWSDDGFGLYGDRKARNVGDIITIIISESSSATRANSASNSKSGSNDLAAGTGIFHFLAAASASQSDSFQANGNLSNTNSVTGRVTVQVVEVKPNGNMVVSGTQSIVQNKDEHKITITGVVRRDDVTLSNTVLSNQVADAKLTFDGKGPLNAKQRQGILTQILNILF